MNLIDRLVPALRCRRTHLGWLLPLGALIHLAVTFVADDASDRRAADTMRPEILALAAVAALVPPLLQAVRLRAWLKCLEEDRSLRTPLRIVAASEVGAAVTPSALGGAPVKTVMLVRRGHDLPTAAAVTTLGSLEDLAFNLVVAIPALLGSGMLGQVILAHGVGRWRTVGLSALGALLVLAVAGALALRTRRGRVLKRRFRDGAGRFGSALSWAGRERRSVLIGNVILACLQWSLRYSLLPLLALGLGHELPWLRAALLQWVGFALCTLAPTPGAVGGAEAMFVALYRGMLDPAAIPGMLSAWRLLTFYWVVGAATLLLALVVGAVPKRGVFTHSSH